MMAPGDQAEDAKLAIWAALEALGKSRPQLLVEGDAPNIYVARWQGSAVPGHVLAGRLKRALEGSTILSRRSFPGGTRASGPSGKPAARHSVTIEFALGQAPGAREESAPCVEG